MTLRKNLTSDAESIQILLRIKLDEQITQLREKTTITSRDCFLTYAWERDTQEFVRYHLVPDLEKAAINLIVDYNQLTISKNVVDPKAY